MGELKNKKLNNESKEHALTNYEFNFIMALAANRNDAYNKYQTAISSFLAFLAGSKWGYKDQLLDFNFDDEKKTVTVTPRPEEKKEV